MEEKNKKIFKQLVNETQTLLTILKIQVRESRDIQNKLTLEKTINTFSGAIYELVERVD